MGNSTANKHLAQNAQLMRQAAAVVARDGRRALAEFARLKGVTAGSLREAMSKAGYGRSARGRGCE